MSGRGGLPITGNDTDDDDIEPDQIFDDLTPMTTRPAANAPRITPTKTYKRGAWTISAFDSDSDDDADKTDDAADNEETADGKENNDSSRVRPRSVKRTIEDVKYHNRVVTPLFTSKERLAVFTLSPKIGDDRVMSDATSSGPLGLNQNIYELIDYVNSDWNGGLFLVEPLVAELVAKRFLAGGADYDAHVARIKNRESVLRDAIKDVYAIDNRKPVDTTSFAAPRLHFGKLTLAEMQKLTDQNPLVVVKMYALGRIWLSAEQLVDLMTDIVVGGAMSHLLVLGHSVVVSPHMAFPLDWFPGPAVDVKTDPFSKRPQLEFIPNVASQYVVVERADTTLYSLLKEKSPPTPIRLRSLLWQILYTLESADDVAGYKHGDFHPDNVMVRLLATEAASHSSYRDKGWLYVRSSTHRTGPVHAVLSATEHGNFFIEIIDNGRASAYCPLFAPDEEHDQDVRVLMGNGMYSQFGIYLDPVLHDKSWDIRRFFAYVAIRYNLISRLRDARRGNDTKTVTLCENLQELFAVGGNMAALIWFMLDNEARIRAQFDATERTAVNIFYMGVKSVAQKLATATATTGRDGYIPPRTVAVEIYNCIGVHFFGRTKTQFRSFLMDVFLAMTIAPITPLTPDGIPTSRNKALTPSLCLGLPLFADLAYKTDKNLVLVGMVHTDWTKWSTAPGKSKVDLKIEALAEENLEKDAKRQRFQSSTFAASESAPVITHSCVTCAREARGFMLDPSSQGNTARAFCSDVCMQIHTGTITAVHPF